MFRTKSRIPFGLLSTIIGVSMILLSCASGGEYRQGGGFVSSGGPGGPGGMQGGGPMSGTRPGRPDEAVRDIGGFSEPQSIAVDTAGNIYYADSGNNRIKKIDTIGKISIIAGTGARGYSGDGGPAVSAKLFNPCSIAADAFGNLYIADSGNNRIRKIDTTGKISTIAGTGARGYSGDGGPAVSAKLSNPCGIAVDAAGNLYIVDTGNDCIRKVDTVGIIKTIVDYR